jgi:adenine deaminase
MRTYEEIRTTVEAGLGRSECDLKLTNLKLVNVFSNEIYDTDIYIKGKRIVSIDPKTGLIAKETRDCKGAYALPGFIDSHMHFETMLLSPEALAEILVPTGTTTICADPMEIANVAGKEGLEEILKSINDLPFRTFIEVPSRVPTAPGLETTGGILDLAGVTELLDSDDAISLGEMDPSKILFLKDEYLKKIANTLKRRKIVNGHAIGRVGQELNIYASSGISDDHECVTYEELLERIRLGMSVLVREGSTERNCEELIKGVLAEGLDTTHLMFCTDDKHVNDILNEGHINYNVNKAIKLGMEPMQAIQMATINTARHFRIEDEIGSITPGRKADILLTHDITKIKPHTVIFEGEVVTEEGIMVSEIPARDYPEWIRNTVILKSEVTAESFQVKTEQTDKVDVNVIGITGDQIINEWLTDELQVVGGNVANDLGNDILKLAVVERYGKNGNIGVGYVQGFGLKRGALAASVSHDHHNIVTVGTNDTDMALAANTVADIQGGLAVVLDGKVLAKMALRIGGLMSDLPAKKVIQEIEKVNLAVRELGCELPAPFMTLEFISLPTVPELGLTDMGLIDVLAHKIITTTRE